MSSSEQQRLEEERLQEEIEELRSDLGETVEALVHKADVPARAKERGNELKDQAVERGGELLERGNGLKERAVARSSDLRDQAIEAAEQVREAVIQTPRDRWVKLACAGLAMIAVAVMVRRVRAS